MTFVPGLRYRVIHKSPEQRYARVSIMDFLAEHEHHYVFSARPIAGTQTMPKGWVLDKAVVAKETPISMNRRYET